MRTFKKPYKRQLHSSKQYDHFKTLGAIPLPTFPTTLLAPYYIDVQDGNKCTAFSGVKERYGVTGVRYDGDKQYELEKKYAGKPANYDDGFDIETKMETGLKKNFGFIPVGFTDPTDGAECYFYVKQLSGFDFFDSFRIAILQLYQKYGKVIPITIGVNWYRDWDNTPNGILTDNPKSLLGGHDIEIAGLETFTIDNTDYLVLAGTWGIGFGDQGIFRAPRTVFNKYFAGYGAAYWSDDATLIPAKMNVIVVLLKNLVVLYQRLIAQKTVQPVQPPIVPPDQVIPPPAPTHVSQIPALAQGIFEAEGNGKQAGMSLNNRGDLKFTEYTKSLGAIGAGVNNLAIFPTLAIGDQACMQLCKDAVSGLLKGYQSTMTLDQFVDVYAEPPTKLAHDNYVLTLLKYIKGRPNQISELL